MEEIQSDKVPMGLRKGVLITCICSSLTDVKMCPFKPQVVTVVVGQNVGIFVLWNINDMYSLFLLLKLLSFKKGKICFVSYLSAYLKKCIDNL